MTSTLTESAFSASPSFLHRPDYLCHSHSEYVSLATPTPFCPSATPPPPLFGSFLSRSFSHGSSSVRLSASGVASLPLHCRSLSRVLITAAALICKGRSEICQGGVGRTRERVAGGPRTNRWEEIHGFEREREKQRRSEDRKQ